MFEVMYRVAKFSCDYVKRARTVGGLAHLEWIKEMDKELSEVIEDFGRAVNVEALHLARKNEQDFLLRRLKSIDTGYHQDLRCMEGTRQLLLEKIKTWVANETKQKSEINTYWVYGSPGIGKTSLAHSICATLHEGKHLAGAFFCRRDDPNLSEPRNILPTLIYKLAIIFPPFGRIVAEGFRNDPNLTPESMQYSLFLDFICKLPRPPKRSLVFIIDALDECGDDQSRPGILTVLADATTQAPWLKIIITSRPEVDIQRFFNTPTRSSHLQYDLVADEEATSDLRKFAQDRFSRVASRRHLQSPWPEPSLFNGVISRAAGLFIFIKTVALTLEQCKDPTETLKATLQDLVGSGLTPLYGLYANILQARIVHSSAEFRRVVGVLLTTALYHPLREETIAELAGVDTSLVKTWVDDLIALIYRDERANGAIRVRHLSISDFFVSDGCPCDYQVNLRDANKDLGIICLNTMIVHLRFNICKLEDSRLANAAVHGLESRIKENISDALQYSSHYWSNHLCFTPDHDKPHMLRSLKEFFEGLYPLFWIEVLSITGMVPIGAPNLRRVISWLKDADSTLLVRIQDVCRFIITFHTAVSISAPHTYISSAPFLPSRSPFSTIFDKAFTRVIKMESGELLSWPEPPFGWTGHTRTVNCTRYSPDGHYIVSGSSDKTIRIWDAETGAVVGEPLSGHTGRVWSIAYSPDGRHIISGSGDDTVRIWDARTRAAVGKPLEGHTGGVTSVTYSPDGRYIISGSRDSTIRIWDAETGDAVGKPLQGHSKTVWGIACSPDGRHIISGSYDRTVRIWDANTGAAVGKPLVGHTSYVLSVAYSPDGRNIISGSDDTTIRIWDAGTGASVNNPLRGHTKGVMSIACSPDGRHIISGSRDRTIRIWDAKTGAAAGEPLEGHNGRVWAVAYSPDGWYIISGSDDKTIRMWSAETGVAVGNPQEGYTSRVWSVAYSPTEQHITSGSKDNIIRIWDAKTGALVGRPLEGHTDHVWSVAYSPDGRHIISGSRDRTIRIWDAYIGAAVSKPLEGHTLGVVSVTYSPDGQHIISGSNDRTIRIWDAKTGAGVSKPLKGHTEGVMCVAYSPDAVYIISGSIDRTIRIWDSKTGAAVGCTLTGHTDTVRSIAFSPNGRCIISGSADSTIRIWDAETGAAVGKPLVGHNGAVPSVAYSPDGRYIISCSIDRTIRIWDAETGAALGDPLVGHNKCVSSVIYSPDGKHIVSGSFDNTVKVWDSFPLNRSQPFSSHEPIRATYSSRPDPDGWVRDSGYGLLYWVPPDWRTRIHSPALLTIYLGSPDQPVSLNFEDFAFGTDWTQIFKSVQP